MQKRWKILQECLQGYKEILILLHDDPDPDALACGVALEYLLSERLGLPGKIAYRGVIGRAENRALVDFLNHEMTLLADEETSVRRPDQAVALLDTQPGAGNSPIPADFDVDVVIDHHGDREDEAGRFRDVRPWIGASSTILTQYLQAAELKPSMPVATALFYGIKTDTKALSRDTSAADISAYFYLLEYVDIDALVQIENAEVSPGYFRSLTHAMQTACVFDSVVFSFLGETDYPDLAAEVADLLLRLEGVAWAVCMGVYEGNLHLSVRARSEDADAEKMAQEIIGDAGSAGGRNTLAGGQLSLNGVEPEAVVEEIKARALDYLQIPSTVEAKPLVW